MKWIIAIAFIALLMFAIFLAAIPQNAECIQVTRIGVPHTYIYDLCS